jgi:hypothetical protein
MSYVRPYERTIAFLYFLLTFNIWPTAYKPTKNTNKREPVQNTMPIPNVTITFDTPNVRLYLTHHAIHEMMMHTLPPRRCETSGVAIAKPVRKRDVGLPKAVPSEAQV